MKRSHSTSTPPFLLRKDSDDNEILPISSPPSLTFPPTFRPFHPPRPFHRPPDYSELPTFSSNFPTHLSKKRKNFEKRSIQTLPKKIKSFQDHKESTEEELEQILDDDNFVRDESAGEEDFPGIISISSPQLSEDEDFARKLQVEEFIPFQRLNSHPTIPLSLQLSMIDRDFTDDDYELLLKLDENVKSKKGATKTQIKSIPLETVKKSDKVESCCICLSEMVAKERVRILPCGHRFHRQCIDTWLKENRICPIDKKSI